jgi:ABC-type polar amino acid transport system ATPase subunit
MVRAETARTLTTASGPTAAMDERVVHVQGLSKRFGGTTVLRGVDFGVSRGETVCILGRNGSGKTTLLRCLNLLVEPTAGRIFFGGRLIGEWADGSRRLEMPLTQHRARIGMVFQHFDLFPHLSALDNITLGPRHVLGVPRPTAEMRGRELLRRVGLESLAEAKPNRLSGGQKQRIAIARALAMEPALVLFDEPTSALDAEMVDEVLNLMKSLAAEGTTMIVVTHEFGFARDVADRVVVMDEGHVIEEGRPAVVFDEPRHDRTREILRRRSR